MENIKLFLLFMIPGTFFAGLLDVVIRYALREGKINERLLLAFNFLFSGILISFLFIFFFDFPEIKQGFWLALFMTSVIGMFGHWTYYKAFSQDDASVISPTRLLTPPFVLITGFFILGEKASFWGMVGVLTTIAGLWFLVNPEGKKLSLAGVFEHKGILLGILGALFFAFSFPFDKKAVVTSSALFFSAVYLVVVGFASLIIYAVQKKDFSIYRNLKANWRIIFLMVAVNIAGFFLTAQALNYTLAAYAASVKRLWSFWAVVLSGQLLGEKDIGRRLAATSIMLSGIVITTLFG
ncbi:MAG: DMT family transporter [Patescibacteria group bacterium]